MPHNRQTRPARRLLRSPFPQDSIPKPVGLGSQDRGVQLPSRFYQEFFKTSSRNVCPCKASL
jgi:hypothetical protein